MPPFSALRVGMRWKTTCASRSNSILGRSTVVGIRTLRVAGQNLKALHIRSIAVLEGEGAGRVERDDWLRKSDGLVLRRTAATEAHFDFAGGGYYSEQYSLKLLSSRPSR